jgi:carbonic anhydrase
MKKLPDIFKKNRAWASQVSSEQPDFFRKLAEQQSPKYLWIGCSDSRVPANQIMGLLPGEVFVHRNIANVVVHTDLNCLSVIQYAVEVLKVEHIIVCGHYGCGGVLAAWQGAKLGLIDNWLRNVQDVSTKYHEDIAQRPDDDKCVDRLCELNVIEQALHVCRSTIVQDAWRRNQTLTVHGWVYRLQSGLLQDIGITLSSEAEHEEFSRRKAMPGAMF